MGLKLWIAGSATPTAPLSEISPYPPSSGIALRFRYFEPANAWGTFMPSNIIYIIGLVVVVLAVLAFFGFR